MSKLHRGSILKVSSLLFLLCMPAIGSDDLKFRYLEITEDSRGNQHITGFLTSQQLGSPLPENAFRTPSADIIEILPVSEKSPLYVEFEIDLNGKESAVRELSEDQLHEPLPQNRIRYPLKINVPIESLSIAPSDSNEEKK